jgi:hypothetical protein
MSDKLDARNRMFFIIETKGKSREEFRLETTKLQQSRNPKAIEQNR